MHVGQRILSASIFGLIGFAFAPHPVQASPTITIGGGLGVLIRDRTATFDLLREFGDADLAHYTEDGLRIQTPTSTWNDQPCGANACPGIWYTGGGYGVHDTRSENLDRIGTTDGARMFAVELQFFNGRGDLYAEDLVWEIYRDLALVASGAFDTPSTGTVFGIVDPEGFDEIRLGTYLPLPAGSWRDNTLAIDNLTVRLMPLPARVPEPSSAFLICLGLLAWSRAWRVRSPQRARA
jgi:hypothetical protein